MSGFSVSPSIKEQLLFLPGSIFPLTFNNHKGTNPSQKRQKDRYFPLAWKGNNKTEPQHGVKVRVKTDFSCSRILLLAQNKTGLLFIKGNLSTWGVMAIQPASPPNFLKQSLQYICRLFWGLLRTNMWFHACFSIKVKCKLQFFVLFLQWHHWSNLNFRKMFNSFVCKCIHKMCLHFETFETILLSHTHTICLTDCQTQF